LLGYYSFVFKNIYLKDKLSNAKLINIIRNYNIAYENHRWGLAPIHYKDEYYNCALKMLENIVLN